MNEMKHYNSRYLRGDENYTDQMFQADMAELGITVPDQLLGTPELHKHVAAQIRDQNIAGMVNHTNPDTGLTYTPEEAKDYADRAYQNVLEKMSTLSGVDLTK